MPPSASRQVAAACCIRWAPYRTARIACTQRTIMPTVERAVPQRGSRLAACRWPCPTQQPQPGCGVGFGLLCAGRAVRLRVRAVPRLLPVAADAPAAAELQRCAHLAGLVHLPIGQQLELQWTAWEPALSWDMLLGRSCWVTASWKCARHRAWWLAAEHPGQRCGVSPVIPVWQTAQEHVALMSTISNQASFIWKITSLKRAVAFCRLTQKLYMDDQLAALSAILFSCNPASVFFSAVYSESVFALLMFSALSSLAQRPLYAAALFGLSTAARSNGIVSGIFVGHDGLQRLQKLHMRTFSGGSYHLVRTCAPRGSRSVGSVQAWRHICAVSCRQGAHHIADSCRRPAGRTAPAGLPMAWLSGFLSWTAPAAAGVVLCHLAIPVRPCAGAVLGRGLPALLPAAAGGAGDQTYEAQAEAYNCVSPLPCCMY